MFVTNQRSVMVCACWSPMHGLYMHAVSAGPRIMGITVKMIIGVLLQHAPTDYQILKQALHTQNLCTKYVYAHYIILTKASFLLLFGSYMIPNSRAEFKATLCELPQPS